MVNQIHQEVRSSSTTTWTVAMRLLVLSQYICGSTSKWFVLRSVVVFLFELLHVVVGLWTYYYVIWMFGYFLENIEIILCFTNFVSMLLCRFKHNGTTWIAHPRSPMQRHNRLTAHCLVYTGIHDKVLETTLYRRNESWIWLLRQWITIHIQWLVNGVLFCVYAVRIN